VSEPIISGCEPISSDGSAVGVLLLHGFTGCPFSLAGVADKLTDAGFGVEVPLLPGHGTAVDDLLESSFAEWTEAAEAALSLVAARTEQVFVGGLSMGGGLTCWLAERHPELAGIILINPLVEPVDVSFVDALQDLVDQGTTVMDAIGSDIKKEGVEERSYPATPLVPLLSLLEGVKEISADLGKISCPVLLLSSVEDHVVPPSSGPHLLAAVSAPIEQVLLEDSYHVATLDNDAALVEAEALAFVERVLEQGA
jgi:carboxylesterase